MAARPCLLLWGPEFHRDISGDLHLHCQMCWHSDYHSEFQKISTAVLLGAGMEVCKSLGPIESMCMERLALRGTLESMGLVGCLS